MWPRPRQNICDDLGHRGNRQTHVGTRPSNSHLNLPAIRLDLGVCELRQPAEFGLRLAQGERLRPGALD
eukprot:4472572-Lingulodinium_polyedra.AAC.1